jgi:hypothetical protein
MSTASSPASRMCTECSEPIPAKRLQVRPNATRCVFCQTSHDEIAKEYSVDLSRLNRFAVRSPEALVRKRYDVVAELLYATTLPTMIGVSL